MAANVAKLNNIWPTSGYGHVNIDPLPEVPGLGIAIESRLS
jgi:hypothetical protein